MQLGTTWAGPVPPDVWQTILNFLVGSNCAAINRNNMREMIALTDQVEHRTWALAEVIRDSLAEAGLHSSHNAHPSEVFRVLQSKYMRLPSLATLSNLLIADLCDAKDTALDEHQETPMFLPYVMRRGVWHEALQPALQLMIAMKQWNISGPLSNLMTPQELEIILRLFNDALNDAPAFLC